jgi:NADH-quinone oxidoreductase subunit A
MINILTPPAAFIIILIAFFLFSGISSFFSMKGKETAGKTKAYSCGEELASNKAQPDYSQFFPFAFFFTIMHVLVLIIATAPKGIVGLPLAYVGAGVIALFILFRR